MKAQSDSTEYGGSLIGSLVAVAIASVIAAGLATVYSRGFTYQTHLEQRTDQMGIRDLLASSIDCRATLASAGINEDTPGSSCASTSAPGGQVGPFLRLYRRTSSGPKALTGPLAANGSARLGRFDVRASCSGTERTLVVRLARVNEDGTNKKDAMTGKEQGWDARNALVFGDPTVDPRAFPLCFGGAPSREQVHSFSRNFSAGNFSAGSGCESSAFFCTPWTNTTYTASSVARSAAGWPALQSAGVRRISWALNVTSNWNGSNVTEFPFLESRLLYRVNGGSWQVVGVGSGLVTHNHGAAISASGFVQANHGDRLEFTPQFRAQHYRHYQYTSGPSPMSSTYVSDWNVSGSLELKFLD